MTEPRQLAVVREYSELIDAMRARLVALNITHATLDRLTGLQVGYCGKILGEAGIRSLGPISFGPMLQALALKLVVVEDVEAAQRMEGRWEACEHPERQVAMRTAPLGKKQIERASKAVLQEMQKRSRSTIPKRVRRRTAKRAAKARWQPQISKIRRAAALARWAKAKLIGADLPPSHGSSPID